MSDNDAARQRADYIRALREERHALEVRGKTDRIAEVDAELARFGIVHEDGKSPKRDAAGPRGRRTTKG